MALWAGSAINTNETAKVFNKLAEMKSLPMIVKFNGLLYAMTGKDMQGLNSTENGWMRSSSITGKNVEIPLLGVLAAPAGIADASQTSARTVTYGSADYGAAEFPIAHYGYVQGIPDSELMRFQGKEAKTLDYLQERYDYIMWSYEDVFGTALNTSAAPSRTVLGGWNYAVDASNTYGTIDRSDAANSDFRGVVNASFGDLTLPKLQAAKNQLRKNKGDPKVFVAGETLYNKVQTQVQNYTIINNYSPDKAQFGSDNWVFAGMTGIYEQRAVAGQFGLLDPKWWMLIQNDQPFTSTGVVRDITLQASHVIHTTVWIQDICQKPNANFRGDNAT